MAYHTVALPFMTPEDGEIEIEFEVGICRAEPDVGIMSDYADEWSISAVDGSTDLSDDRKAQITAWLMDEYGSEERLLEVLAENID